jgi:hypothetical protein
MPKRELDFRYSLLLALVPFHTRNREKRCDLLFLSSAARSIEPFVAFARLRLFISASPLLRCFMGCSAIAAVAVQLLYRVGE